MCVVPYHVFESLSPSAITHYANSLCGSGGSGKGRGVHQQAIQQTLERVHLLREPLVAGLRLQSRPRFLEVIAHRRRDAFEVCDLLRNGALVVVHREVTMVS